MLGVSRKIYVNVDSPNLGFPYFNFLGEAQWKKQQQKQQKVYSTGLANKKTNLKKNLKQNLKKIKKNLNKKSQKKSKQKSQKKIKKNLKKINNKKTQSLMHYYIIALMRGSHGLSARRARRTKSRRPEGPKA